MKNLSLLKIEVSHENCWTHYLERSDMESLKVMPLYRERDRSKKNTQTYVVARGSRDQLSKFLRSEPLSDYHPVAVGSLGKNNKQVSMLVKLEFRHSNSMFNLQFDNLFFRDILYKKNHEVWYMMGSTTFVTKSLLEIVEKVKDIGKVVKYEVETGGNIMNYFFSKSLDFYFSDLQMSHLMNLYNLGFFNFPRDLTIEQASSELNISKGYISKLVRNAQKTMLEKYQSDMD